MNEEALPETAAVDETAVPVTSKSTLLHLIVDENDHTSPSLRFSWCLRPAGLEALRERAARYPHLLVIIAKERQGDWQPAVYGLYEEVDRLVIPLDQAYGAYEFERPGRFAMFATVVWSDREDSGKRAALKQLRGLLQTNSLGDGYEHATIFHHDRFAMHPGHCYRIDDMDMVHIKIDESLFAKEPPRWLWNWANLFHETPAKNQCMYRHRLFVLSLPKAPLALLLALWHVLFRILFVPAFLLSGWRPNSLNLRPIYHPFSTSLDEMTGLARYDHYAMYSKDALGNSCRRAIHERIIRMPITWVLAYVAGFAAIWYFERQLLIALHAVVHAITWLIIELFHLFWNNSTMIILISLTVVASRLLHNHLKLLDATETVNKPKTEAREREVRRLQQERERLALEHQKQEHRARERARLDTFYAARLQPLTCSSDTPREGQTVSVAALPASHRTIVVRFMELKSKVCLPFARGK